MYARYPAFGAAMKVGTLTVSGHKFRLPCVYEFLLNGVVLYVGHSGSGLSRAFRGYQSRGFGKASNRRKDAFSQCDDIRVTVFDNTEEARDYERALILKLQPPANIHHKK